MQDIKQENIAAVKSWFFDQSHRRLRDFIYRINDCPYEPIQLNPLKSPYDPYYDIKSSAYFFYDHLNIRGDKGTVYYFYILFGHLRGSKATMEYLDIKCGPESHSAGRKIIDNIFYKIVTRSIKSQRALSVSSANFLIERLKLKYAPAAKPDDLYPVTNFKVNGAGLYNIEIWGIFCPIEEDGKQPKNSRICKICGDTIPAILNTGNEDIRPYPVTWEWIINGLKRKSSKPDICRSKQCRAVNNFCNRYRRSGAVNLSKKYGVPLNRPKYKDIISLPEEMQGALKVSAYLNFIGRLEQRKAKTRIAAYHQPGDRL